MNEDQKRILAEAIIEAFEIIERNMMKVIDEKFDAIIDGKGEAESALSEDDVQSIVRDMVNGGEITVDISV
tara:strand:- start:221 stop:433 length:213 start_codon:yes stop_codon:yes gene_type:complete